MKILHILSSVNKNSGIANFVMNYYRNIDRENCQFDFLVFWQAPKSFNEEIESLGGKVYYFTKPGLKTYAKAKKELKEFFSAHKGEYGIVHCHEILVAKQVFSAARKFGGNPKCISHSHSSILSNSFLRKIRNRILIQGLAKKSDYCFACSSQAAVCAFGEKILNRKKYKLILNAIDTDKYKFSLEEREKIRREFNIKDELLLGDIGRLDNNKNQIFAIKILQSLIKDIPCAKLLLVGDGEDRQMLENYVRRNALHNNVIFTGSRSDIPSLLSAMDYFVFPSKFEGFGIALIEAQANDLCCMCYKTLPKEVFVNDNIFTFDKNS